MTKKQVQWRRDLVPCLVWGICAAGIGCSGRATCPRDAPAACSQCSPASCSQCASAGCPQDTPIPRELRMTAMPTYRIEPSDILIIQTMNLVPKPPYRVQPLDGLIIQAKGTEKERDIWGLYPIEPGGTVNLGLEYGTVQVAGLTIEEAQKAVQEHLGKILRMVTVQVSLGQSRARQQVQGDHLVRQDGTIGVGLYGSVYIAGMTIDEAKKAIEDHLSQFFRQPEISLDVFAYNSKWYYLIMDRAGWGQTVYRFPITGRDTVLDALSNFGGTGFMSSKRHLWLARPNGQDPKQMQIFPVNWPALAKGGSPATNYQLFPGDRIYVQSNPLMRINNRMMQVFQPFQTFMGSTLLGFSLVGEANSVVQGIQQGAAASGFFR